MAKVTKKVSTKTAGEARTEPKTTADHIEEVRSVDEAKLSKDFVKMAEEVSKVETPKKIDLDKHGELIKQVASMMSAGAQLGQQIETRGMYAMAPVFGPILDELIPVARLGEEKTAHATQCIQHFSEECYSMNALRNEQENGVLLSNLSLGERQYLARQRTNIIAQINRFAEYHEQNHPDMPKVRFKADVDNSGYAMLNWFVSKTESRDPDIKDVIDKLEKAGREIAFFGNKDTRDNIIDKTGLKQLLCLYITGPDGEYTKELVTDTQAMQNVVFKAFVNRRTELRPKK